MTLTKLYDISHIHDLQYDRLQKGEKKFVKLEKRDTLRFCLSIEGEELL